jgi:2-polyprenyl-3-methyl-5-hydroxy-6-metoxy-1,4-benzoquinol methylase
MSREIEVLSPAMTVSMADEWYDFASADHFWMQWRFNVLMPHLKKILSGNIASERFLEIGCGHGQFIEQLDNTIGVVTDGCDLNLMALEKIDSIRGKIYVYDINQFHPSMIDRYSGIFLLDVIEHIDDDVTFIKNSIRHLKIGGYVFVNVPALNALFSSYDTAAGHKRRYTKAMILNLFKEAGIEPLSIQYWGLSLISLVLIRKLYLKFVPSAKIIEKGFNPPSPVFNKLLKTLMAIELRLFKSPFLGTSVMAVGKKVAP